MVDAAGCRGGCVRLVSGAIAAGLVVTAGMATAASDQPSTFAVRSLSYAGGSALAWPSVAVSPTGVALVLSSGPVAWTSADGSDWSIGRDADPGNCEGTGTQQGP